MNVYPEDKHSKVGASSRCRTRGSEAPPQTVKRRGRLFRSSLHGEAGTAILLAMLLEKKNPATCCPHKKKPVSCCLPKILASSAKIAGLTRLQPYTNYVCSDTFAVTLPSHQPSFHYIGGIILWQPEEQLVVQMKLAG